MSHIQTLNGMKEHCDTTGQCSEYQSYIQHENARIDSYTSSGIQSTITWGIVITIIGLAVLLTPFVKPLQKIQSFILPKLAIVVPILIGLIGGVFVGFMISFSACFKQACSLVEESAMFTIPLLTLILTIPLARKIYRKRQAVATSVAQPKPLVWIIIGSLIIFISVIYALDNVAGLKQIGEIQKGYLLNSKP